MIANLTPNAISSIFLNLRRYTKKVNLTIPSAVYKTNNSIIISTTCSGRLRTMFIKLYFIYNKCVSHEYTFERTDFPATHNTKIKFSIYKAYTCMNRTHILVYQCFLQQNPSSSASIIFFLLKIFIIIIILEDLKKYSLTRSSLISPFVTHPTPQRTSSLTFTQKETSVE